ncbi:tail protein X [Thermoanaerobacterium sp. DL9XJH110]|uniref:tail protein X n=1 Tax=Thermoanaerobacterium sp. DL9XJH110 TaxID=3386643 RepID=UPI003BB7AFFA
MATNYFEYITMQGDTFDMLALDAYNDEFKAHLIIQANPQYASVLVFDAGVKLKIPIIEQEAAATLPPWKR